MADTRSLLDQCDNPVPGHDVAVPLKTPDVNFFAFHLEGEAAALLEKHHELAQSSGTFLFLNLRPDAVPGFSKAELHCWGNAEAADLDRVRDFIHDLLD